MPKINLKNNYQWIFQYNKVLLSIVLFGFLLRIWGIWNADSTDEYNEVFEALRVCSGHLNFERWGKRFYLYVLSIAYGIYYLIGWVFQVFHSPADFATKIVRNLDPLFYIGRSISASFGTASVFMTYVIGKSIFNNKVGLVASFFFCLNVVNIELSHYARVDATLCLVILISFYFIAQILWNKQHSLKYYLLAGLFSGIAFQNKAPAIILLFPFLFAHISGSKPKKIGQYIFCKEIVYYSLFFLAGLVVGNPPIIFAPHKFVMSLLGLGQVYTTPINETQSDFIGFVAYLLYFYRELGLLLSGLALYSILKAFFSKQKEEILLLVFIIPFYILMGGSRFMVSTSYMLPLMPFLYLLMAKYLVEIVQKFNLSPNRLKMCLIFSCIILLIHPFINVMKLERSFLGPNTRILAKEWIETNIPFGSKILMDSGKSINSFAPKIAEDRASIKRALSSKKEAIENKELLDPTKMVSKNSLIYYELRLKTVPKEAYDITSTMFGLNVKPMNYYINNQFQYFIISKNMKRSRSADFFTEKHQEIAKFYNSLDVDKRLKLLKVIDPTSRNRGDTFYIYEVIS